MSAPLSLTSHGPEPSAGEPPLVLLHAFPLDARMWGPVLDRLTDLSVLTLDAPGFGSSPPARQIARALGCPDAPSLRTYADAVAATLDAAGVHRAVLAGLSMGGYTVLALAERHPALLAGLGLLDTKATADPPEARAARTRMAAQAAGTLGSRAVAPMIDTVLSPVTHRRRPEVLELVRGWLGTAPPHGIAWAQRAMAARPDRLAVLTGVSVPALVLRGADDAGATQADAEAMTEALRDVEDVVVPDAGHLSAVETPGPVAEALRTLHARARRA